MRRPALFVSLSLIAAALAGCVKHPPETKDRLTPEAMEQIVSDPMTTVRKTGLVAGRADFEQLLAANEARYGSDSVRVADLFTAFGVGLNMEGASTGNEAELTASRDYLRDAIPRYRKAFGANDPEVAVALHTFADADISAHGHLPTAEAEGALEEALRIRRTSLGPHNAETQATERRLAYLRHETAYLRETNRQIQEIRAASQTRAANLALEEAGSAAQSQ